MHPNSFTNRHVTSVLNRFYTSSVFQGSVKYNEFQNYHTFRFRFNSSIHSFIFYALCFQLMTLGLEPFVNMFWNKDENTSAVIKWLSYTSLTKMVPVEVGGVNLEALIVLGFIVLDTIVYFTAFFIFIKIRRVPMPLMYVLKYLELGLTTFMVPMYMAAFATLMSGPQSTATSLLYPILIFIMVIKCNINIMHVQSSTSPSAHFYYTIKSTTPRIYLMLIGIMAFFASLNTKAETYSEKALNSITIVIFVFLNIWELVYFNWNKVTECLIILTLVSSCLVASIVIDFGLHFEAVQPTHVFIAFFTSILVFSCFYSHNLKKVVSKTLKRLAMPEYPQLVKSGKQAAQDLLIGFSEVSPSVINMTLLEELHHRFFDSPDLNLVLVFMSLVLDDFPIPLHELQHNLRLKNFTISTTLEIDEEEYLKDVEKTEKRLWKAIGAMKEFYKSIMNEMIDFIPFNSLQCHDLIEKTATNLLYFLEKYPGRDDGRFFFDLFRRIAPKHPSIKEMEYWCNYRINYVEEVIDIYPKLTILLLNNQDTLYSYIPKQPNAIGKSVVEILQREEVFTGRTTSKIADSGPFTMSISNFLFISLFIIVFVFFVVITNAVMYPYTLQTHSLKEVLRIYQFAEKSVQILTHIYPFEFFHKDSTYGDFWNDKLQYENFREYLLLCINDGQNQLMSFSYKPSEQVSEKITNMFRNTFETVYNYAVLGGDYTMYQANFGFLYLSSEIILNNTILLPPGKREVNESIKLLGKFYSLIKPLYTALVEGISGIDLFENNMVRIYVIIGIGLFLVDILVPICVYTVVRKANSFNNAFFTSLRDTQKTALTDINNFLHTQMKNLWVKRVVWHPSTKTKYPPLWVTVTPFFILVVLFTIMAISLATCYNSYRTMVKNAISIHHQTTHQYSILCYIVWGNFIYTLGGAESHNSVFYKAIKALHNDFAFKSEQKMGMASYARQYNIHIYNWLDDAIIQDWISSSTIFLNIRSSQQNRIELLRDYFIRVDKECFLLTRKMESQWSDSLNHARNDFIATLFFFSFFPVVLIFYTYQAMKKLDRPFMCTKSLLELISESSLSNNTYHVLNNSGFLHEDPTVDQTFYDTILRTLPDAVFVIEKDHSIIFYNTIANELLKDNPPHVGKPILEALNIKFTINNLNIQLNEVLSNYTQDDCTSVPTYEITGKLNGVDRFFELTILPLFKNDNGVYIGGTNRASTFALIFRDCTNETLQQNLIEEDTNKYMKIITQILPPEIAGILLKEQKAISMRVKNVCISFCDIVSFTPWCANQSAESVVTALNTMFTLFDDCCKRYRSVNKIKTIGDCYMSAAGIFDKGDSPEEAAHQMLLFGLDMVDSIKEVNRLLHINLKVRVGIAYGGPISAGLMGIRKPSFDVYGQVVNDGQTMESSGTPMMVHINKELYEIVKDFRVNFQLKEDGTALVTREV